MGSVLEVDEETDRDSLYDDGVEETIYIAVGKNLEKSKATLLWSLRSFVGKKICLLYVHHHNTPHVSNLTDLVSNSEQDAVKEFEKLERERMQEILDRYSLFLAQHGVRADKVWIEMDDTGKGIVEIIIRHNVRWLVMGAAADKYYSVKLSELKSIKAMFVCQQAPISCHTWFVCKGHLIYTRDGRNDGSEAEITLPLSLLDSGSETKCLEYLIPEPVRQDVHLKGCADTEEDVDDHMERLNCQCSVHSSRSSNMLLRTSKSIALLTEEAKASEKLCVKMMCLRKEMEEAVIREKQDVENTRNQRDESMKELQLVKHQKSLLETQLAESNVTVNELEEKIISAVELLISFRRKRDAARIEYENALTEVTKLRKLSKMDAMTCCGSELLEFTFTEINEATHNFDPSWKIGEGRYGSIYKGLLHHAHVAIKMLPSYGSQSQLEFQNMVEVLSRVRHPNLVTLIGTCPESRSLVYEYARNGSLEDLLACKYKTSPMTWQTRANIAVQICSALIFLHTNKPCTIHGNLKPSKVLLDSNFVSKLTDFGIFHLMPQGKDMVNVTQTSYTFSNSCISSYTDPEYLETGMVTPESDVYSFGVILLRLLTGRPVSGIVRDVRCAVEKGKLEAVLDCSGGEWPSELATQFAILALRCCEKSRYDRPDLVLDIWGVLEQVKDCIRDSETCLSPKEPRCIPSHFLCPIFQEVMTDPQIAADGFTYEADAIRGWLKSGHNTSPMTNLKLDHCNLLPNHALHQAIQESQQRSYTLSSYDNVRWDMER